MYAKLFSRITESSIMEEPINVRYTFVMMLAIADPEGYVIGTDVAIARRINMDIREFTGCLAVLKSPDAHSNSKQEDGRRVVESDGERGYRIVNYVTYRDMKDEEERRVYMREYMRKYRGGKQPVNSCKQPLAELTQAEAKAEEPPETTERASSKLSKIEEQEANFAIFWKAYPRKEGKTPAQKAFAKVKAPLQELLDALDKFKKTDQWLRDGGQYIPHAATWINQERWTDEINPNVRNGLHSKYPTQSPGNLGTSNATVASQYT